AAIFKSECAPNLKKRLAGKDDAHGPAESRCRGGAVGSIAESEGGSGLEFQLESIGEHLPSGVREDGAREKKSGVVPDFQIPGQSLKGAGARCSVPVVVVRCRFD